MKPGDPVKLTDRFASALCKAKKAKIDWRARRGIVSYSNERNVAVLWPGLKSVDILPAKAVEVAR